MFNHLYRYDEMKRAEHDAVRNAAGWYLWTHHLIEVTGEDAAAFLDMLHPNPIASLKVGSARYTTMLNEEGTILDDLVIFRMAEDTYWVSTLYANKKLAWFDQHKGDYRVAYQKITESWEMYAVQGPKSKDLINAIAEESVDDQKFFTIRDNKIGGIPVKIARAGFTGEKLGYEIYVDPAEKDAIVAKLKEVGPVFGAKEVTELQIMIWTLPTEKGFYLMSDLRGINPFEAGLDRGIDWGKDFIGKEALLKIKEAGIERTILGFTVADDAAHIEARSLGGPGAAVMLNGEEIGRVTKYTFSYTSDRNIGFALVDAEAVKIGDTVMINDSEAVLTDRIFV